MYSILAAIRHKAEAFASRNFRITPLYYRRDRGKCEQDSFYYTVPWDESCQGLPSDVFWVRWSMSQNAKKGAVYRGQLLSSDSWVW